MKICRKAQLSWQLICRLANLAVTIRLVVLAPLKTKSRAARRRIAAIASANTARGGEINGTAASGATWRRRHRALAGKRRKRCASAALEITASYLAANISLWRAHRLGEIMKIYCRRERNRLSCAAKKINRSVSVS
jgi:hypothetical protein